MLLAFNLLVHTMTLIGRAPDVPAIMHALANQPVLALVAAALLTWVCHSSVAIVPLIVSLAKSGALAPAPAMVLILGANLGPKVPPFLEAGSPVARLLPLGNMLMRTVGCLVALRSCRSSPPCWHEPSPNRLAWWSTFTQPSTLHLRIPHLRREANETFGPGKSWPRLVQWTPGQKQGRECHKLHSPQPAVLQSSASCLLSG
jgi:hypothetical protein